MSSSKDSANLEESLCAQLKSWISDIMDVNQCLWDWAWSMLKDIYAGLRASRWHCFHEKKPCIFQPGNTKLHTASMPTTWLRSKCWTDLSAIQVKIFSTLWNLKYGKEDPGLLRAYNPISVMNEATFFSWKSNSSSPQFPDIYVVKRRGGANQR